MPSRLTDALAIPVPRAGAAAGPNGPGRLQDEVAALFDSYRAPLLRYLTSFGLSVADGEEVLQDVFLSLFQHLRRGKSRENIRGWLFRVAHNLGLRRRYRTRRDSTFDDLSLEALAIDPAPNPEDRMARTQTRRRVLAVVEALPEQDRRCLFLRAEGFRYREIAGVLDISLGAVSLSLARSLARIARSAER